MHKCPVAQMQQVAYTTSMTTALGSYVKTLRLRQGLSKAEVIRRLDTQFGQKADRSTLYRAERGEHWPDGDLLTALLGVIGGRLEDLIWIRRNQDATELDGYNLAQKWLTEFGSAEGWVVVSAPPDEKGLVLNIKPLFSFSESDARYVNLE